MVYLQNGLQKSRIRFKEIVEKSIGNSNYYQLNKLINTTKQTPFITSQNFRKKKVKKV